MSLRHFTALVPLALLFACSAEPNAADDTPGTLESGRGAASQNGHAPAGAVVLTTLRFRDFDLRVLPGGAGPSFVVYDRAGRVLARADDEDALSRSQPEVYDLYRSALAHGLDARLDSRPSARDRAAPVPVVAPLGADSTRR